MAAAKIKRYMNDKARQNSESERELEDHVSDPTTSRRRRNDGDGQATTQESPTRRRTPIKTRSESPSKRKPNAISPPDTNGMSPDKGRHPPNRKLVKPAENSTGSTEESEESTATSPVTNWVTKKHTKVSIMAPLESKQAKKHVLMNGGNSEESYEDPYHDSSSPEKYPKNKGKGKKSIKKDKSPQPSTSKTRMKDDDIRENDQASSQKSPDKNGKEKGRNSSSSISQTPSTSKYRERIDNGIDNHEQNEQELDQIKSDRHQSDYKESDHEMSEDEESSPAKKRKTSRSKKSSTSSARKTMKKTGRRKTRDQSDSSPDKVVKKKPARKGRQKSQEESNSAPEKVVKKKPARKGRQKSQDGSNSAPEKVVKKKPARKGRRKSQDDSDEVFEAWIPPKSEEKVPSKRRKTEGDTEEPISRSVGVKTRRSAAPDDQLDFLNLSKGWWNCILCNEGGYNLNLHTHADRCHGLSDGPTHIMDTYEGLYKYCCIQGLSSADCLLCNDTFDNYDNAQEHYTEFHNIPNVFYDTERIDGKTKKRHFKVQIFPDFETLVSVVYLMRFDDLAVQVNNEACSIIAEEFIANSYNWICNFEEGHKFDYPSFVDSKTRAIVYKESMYIYDQQEAQDRASDVPDGRVIVYGMRRNAKQCWHCSLFPRISQPTEVGPVVTNFEKSREVAKAISQLQDGGRYSKIGFVVDHLPKINWLFEYRLIYNQVFKFAQKKTPKPEQQTVFSLHPFIVQRWLDAALANAASNKAKAKKES